MSNLDVPTQFVKIDHKAINKGRADGRTQGARQFQGMVRNVVNTVNNASPEHKDAGEMWYAEAWDHANHLAKTYGISHKQASGILSALSPRTSWDANKTKADQLLKHGSTYGLKDHVKKARAIRDGRLDPDQAFNPNSAMKTYNFYNNIEEPDDPKYVTMDAHAHDIAVGQRLGSPDEDVRGLGAKGRYNTFADAYKTATNVINDGRKGRPLIPNQVQATAWTAWRGTHE
jgi:hypothetical protein